MTTNLTNAILTDSKLLYSIEHAGNRQQLYTVAVENITNIAEILDLALQHNLHTIWIHPGDSLNVMLYHKAVDTEWDIKVSTMRNPHRGEPDIIKGVSAHRKDGSFHDRRRITIAYPQWNAYQWSPSLAGDPVACLAAIHYCERALGVPVSHNPGLTGRDIMDETNATASRPTWIKAPTFDLSQLPTSIGYDLAYQRGIDPFDIPNMEQWIHSWDKNSMYLAACTSVELPTGDPVYISGAELANEYEATMQRFYDGRRPGYWRIECNNFDLPPISPLYPGQEWVTTPLLKLLYSLGVRCVVREAYVWFEYHRWLDRFASVMWKARQVLKTEEKSYPHAGGRRLAEYSIKRIATASIGLLANQEAARISPQWYRPDVRATIIEEAKARMFYKIMQVHRMFGTLPLLVNVDEIAYLTLERDPHKAFPGMFDRATELGGWKMHHSLAATPAVLSCFKPGLSAGKSTKLLSEIAGHQNTLFELGESA